MKISKKDSALIKAEIEATIFKQAFIELAKEFSRKHPDSFAASGGGIVERLDRFNPFGFYPSEQVGDEELPLKALQQDHFGRAIHTLAESIRIAEYRARKRQ